jgi:hypothetical protein
MAANYPKKETDPTSEVSYKSPMTNCQHNIDIFDR